MTLIVGCLAAAMIASGGVNQSKIDDVKSGKLTEARASWWGFDPTDSTDSVQNAINSGAKRVIIENMDQPWIATPLIAASDQVPEQYVGVPESNLGQIWTLRISKPATGAMEDYYVELQGIPPFLATNPASLLQPAQ